MPFDLKNKIIHKESFLDSKNQKSSEFMIEFKRTGNTRKKESFRIFSCMFLFPGDFEMNEEIRRILEDLKRRDISPTTLREHGKTLRLIFIEKRLKGDREMYNLLRDAAAILTFDEAIILRRDELDAAIRMLEMYLNLIEIQYFFNV